MPGIEDFIALALASRPASRSSSSSMEFVFESEDGSDDDGDEDENDDEDDEDINDSKKTNNTSNNNNFNNYDKTIGLYNDCGFQVTSETEVRSSIPLLVKRRKNKGSESNSNGLTGEERIRQRIEEQGKKLLGGK